MTRYSQTMRLAISRIGNKIACFNLKHIWPDPCRAITRYDIKTFFRADMSMKFGSNRPNRQSYQVKPEMLQPAKVTKRLGDKLCARVKKLRVLMPRHFRNLCSCEGLFLAHLTLLFGV